MSSRKVPKIERSILYYPTIDIPTDRWLRQAILYWDKVSSIYPRALQRRGQQLSIDIQFLEAEGEYIPSHPQKMFRNSFHCHEMETEFFKIFRGGKFQQFIGARKMWKINTQIHIEKMHYELREFLREEGLAIRDGLRRDWYLVETKTAMLYMSLLAKYLSDIDDNFTVPGTDRPEFEELSFFSIDTKQGFPTFSVSLSNALPAPSENVAFEDILRFKRKRKHELLHFREELSKLYSRISDSKEVHDVKEQLVSFQERLERNLNELKQLFDDSKIDMVFGSMKSLISVKSPTAWGAGLAIAGETTNITSLPLDLTLVGLGIVGGLQVCTHLVDERNRDRVALRDSPFAYVYHAKAEGILA